MTLQERIDLLDMLGRYILENTEEWRSTKEMAFRSNHWFIPEFINTSSNNIAVQYLKKEHLLGWAELYKLPQNNSRPRKVGLVMAGNIPLVGFHDMLCTFITGHEQLIKTSSKDDILIKHLVKKLYEYDPAVKNYINFAEQLSDCEVYIATGGNNTGRYFEYYFGKYPHIIRKNRTSVAILEGTESAPELEYLSDDIQLYFGLGCRNVTKLYVPENYNFEELLNALRKYDYYMDFHKYRHNYDYQLALLMMGNKLYMTNGSVLLSENESLFSAISQVHFEYYGNREAVEKILHNTEQLQCIVGKNFVPFGRAQQPSLTDYADGTDTMAFLLNLK
jgi:hypothetical protein